ncbi:MAG: proline racemase family protein [Actinomycetota bacterium]|nr:proline racemase family protein [Actinomycetota bacterium]
MDLTPARSWNPPSDWPRLTVIESHAGGEPFRVVIDGLPDIPGDTILERRRYAEEHLDGLRRALMWEPRGHADMYGGWITPPVREDSDLSILFLHNEGFSTMCGHGIIALTKTVLEMGILDIEGAETTIKIDSPAGQITATATCVDETVTSVRFLNVPSFAARLDASVVVDGLGSVSFDIGFGGAFYAYVDAGSVEVDLSDSNRLVQAGRAIKRAVMDATTLVHPDDSDLAFLYGVIFTGPPTDPKNHSRHVCVFADGEVDRSPTGTGVSGRLALLHARSEIDLDQPITIESIVGSEFSGRIVAETRAGPYPAVLPEVSGTAHIVGRSELWIDPDDPLNPGFFLR